MKNLIFIIIVLSLTMPILVSAYDPYDLLVGAQEQKLFDLIGKIQGLLYWVALGIGLIVVLYSGITYMTSAGDETKTGKAKKTLLYGIVGVIIVFAAIWILDAIGEILGSAGI